MKPWIIAARPRTLPAAIVPVLVGAALAAHEGHFSWLPFIAALLASLLIQIGTNYVNDVFDFLKGADKNRKGPTRATQSGMVTPRQMFIAIAIVFGLAMLLGVYLISVGGWPILMIGLASILAGIAYTAGPFPLAYNGLGDLFAFLFFGVVAVVGTYYTQTLHFSGLAFGISIPVACLVTAIIVVNNCRDIETDRVVNKHTLAVMMGDILTRYYFAGLIGIAYGVVTGLGLQYSLWWLLPWLSAPLAVKLVIDLWQAKQGIEFNRCLAATARLHMIFGLLLALSLIVSK